jgi:hypothetical protein
LLLFSGIEAATTALASSATGLEPAHPALYVVTFNGESVEAGIAHHAATDAAFRASAARLTAAWLSKLRSAKSVTISGLGETGHAAQVASIARLHANLVSGELPRTELTSKTGSMATAAPSAAATLSIDGNNPNSFPVRGAPGSGRTYWTGMTEIVAFHHCDASGCDPDTDRYTSKITVNPGAVTSKVSATNVYYPSSGAFGNKHFELWAINRGSIVGDVDTGNLPASSIDYVKSNRALNGTVLTVAVTLWVYVNPYGTYVADGAKTADATCRPVGDNTCVY